MSKIRLYCNMSQNFLTFKISHDGLFFVFGVPNAKYLMSQTNTFATKKCLILTCGEHSPLLGSTDAKQNTLQLFMI